jgi:hypothetical protein
MMYLSPHNGWMKRNGPSQFLNWVLKTLFFWQLPLCRFLSTTLTKYINPISQATLSDYLLSTYVFVSPKYSVQSPILFTLRAYLVLLSVLGVMCLDCCFLTFLLRDSPLFFIPVCSCMRLCCARPHSLWLVKLNEIWISVRKTGSWKLMDFLVLLCFSKIANIFKTLSWTNKILYYFLRLIELMWLTSAGCF